MSKDWYFAACMTHLSDANTYAPRGNLIQANHLIPAIGTRLKALTTALQLPPRSVIFLSDVTHTRIPKFYVLPKIHKLPTDANSTLAQLPHSACRPIASNV
jgi:hypothetical protein